ncbi:hypothetical protein XENORESO_013908 [Xenotaenia resolanae]|uniref:Uncharacterized protein n=1 Tax=Xenotaenia resolanae TaxID=208358 RepID=A0ABV0W2U2_9TELE
MHATHRKKIYILLLHNRALICVYLSHKILIPLQDTVNEQVSHLFGQPKFPPFPSSTLSSQHVYRSSPFLILPSSKSPPLKTYPYLTLITRLNRVLHQETILHAMLT